MAKKIQAYIDAPLIDPPDQHTKLIASVVAAPFVDADPVRCVTLVVHDGSHERVVTESELIFDPQEAYTAVLVNALRLGNEGMSRLVRDLVERGAVLSHGG